MPILLLMWSLLAPSANAMPLHKLCETEVQNQTVQVIPNHTIVQANKKASFAGKKFESNQVLVSNATGQAIEVGGWLQKSRSYRLHERRIYKKVSRKLGFAPESTLWSFDWLEGGEVVATLVIGPRSWFSASCDLLENW